VTAAEPPAGAQEQPQAAERAATHAPHAPGVSQAATGPLNASPPKENPMTRHTPDEPQDVVTALVAKARELGVGDPPDECTGCGRDDGPMYLDPRPRHPRDPQAVYCRDCAADLFDLDDEEDTLRLLDQPKEEP